MSDLPKPTDFDLQMTLLRAVFTRADGIAVADELRPDAATALKLVVPPGQVADWTATVSWALIEMRDSKKWLSSPFYEAGKKGKNVESQQWMLAHKPGLDSNQRIWQITPSGQDELARYGSASPWQAIDLTDVEAAVQDEGGFVEPPDVEEARKKTQRWIVLRRGQPKFRKELIETYKTCLISGCDAESALEAAHIQPYSANGTNELSNGLLLRADLHTLFDLDLIEIDPESFTVRLNQTLRATTYQRFEGKPLSFPPGTEGIVNKKALKDRWKKKGVT